MSISIELLETYQEQLNGVEYDTAYEDEFGNKQTELLECSLHTVLLADLTNSNAKLQAFVNSGEEEITKVHMNCKETRKVKISFGIHANGQENYKEINEILNNLKSKLRSLQQTKVSNTIKIIGTTTIADAQSAIDANNNKVYFIECMCIYEIKI